jgi:membrane protein
MWGWGRGITALLFVISQCLMELYLGQRSMGSVYGPAGSLVLLLAWVSYASLVCLLGAECAAVYAHRHGSRAAKGWPSASRAGGQ